jgi:y4mF family transcriptional regulator
LTPDLARIVRDRRRDLGLNQHELADLAGVSARFVWSVEDGKTAVRFDLLVKVLDALGLELRTARRTST